MRFLKIREAAEMLSVSEPTLRDWIRSGRLIATKPGRDYRIDVADVIAMLRQHSNGPAGKMSAIPYIPPPPIDSASKKVQV